MAQSSFAENHTLAGRILSLIIAVAFVCAWLLLMLYGAYESLWKPVGFSIVAAFAMLAGSLMVDGSRGASLVRAIDGAASGAMFAGLLIFVLPDALRGHVWHGALGMLAGLAAGVVLTRRSRSDQHDPAVSALTIHALCAGCVIGALYARMPALGIAAGSGIIAHKLPAGYLLSRQLRSQRNRLLDITLPALATGLGALPVALWRPDSALPAGLLLGIASGLFAYVGLLFGKRLPKTTSYRGVEIGAAIIGGASVALIALIGSFPG
ncbi:MAG: hypothetical protein PF501_03615 [Salinisphaera sp.]|jgi:ZIP family zinc transporter|nr:hypothetical protein [Salinisphaera sp.]